MAVTREIITYLFICFVSASFTNGACPTSCHCVTSGQLTITCENVTLADVLPQIDRNVQNLIITESSIPQLKQNTFVDLEFEKLTSLELSNNKLETIGENAFNGLPSLEKLILNQNLISNLPVSFIPKDNNLKVLEMQTNSFNSFPTLETFDKLETLDFGTNKMESISCSAFQSLTNLKTLKINNNKITTIENCTFAGLSKTETISLSGNFIDYVDSKAFETTTKLKTLLLSGNSLREFHSEILAPISGSLEVLSLAGNALADAPIFNNFVNLQRLDISETKIKSLKSNEFENLTALTDLFVSASPFLSEVQPGTFSGLRKLRNLDISGNKQVEAFPTEALTTEENRFIEKLFLNDNGLKTISTELLKRFEELRRLKTVKITGNSLHCDCAALELQKFIISSRKEWVQPWKGEEGPKCYTPVHLKDKLITTVKPRDLTCDPPKIEAPPSLNVTVQNGGLFNLSVVTSVGIPSTVWILPVGLTVKPNEEKAGFTVQEIISEEGIVTSIITKSAFQTADQGAFTMVATNANNGATITIDVTTPSTAAAAAGDVVFSLQANNTENVVANTSDKMILSTASTVDRTTEADTFEKHVLNTDEFIVFFIAVIFVLSVIVVLAVVVKRRGRDIVYHRLPTSDPRSRLKQRTAINYGGC